MPDSEVQHLINDLQRSERRLAETICQLSSLNRLGQFMAASFDIGRIFEEVQSTMQLTIVGS